MAMEKIHSFNQSADHGAKFHSDQLSFNDFREEQERIFAEHSRNIEKHGVSGIEYELHRLYDENPGAFSHWSSSLDGEGK